MNLLDTLKEVFGRKEAVTYHSISEGDRPRLDRMRRSSRPVVKIAVAGKTGIVRVVRITPTRFYKIECELRRRMFHRYGLPQAERPEIKDIVQEVHLAFRVDFGAVARIFQVNVAPDFAALEKAA